MRVIAGTARRLLLVTPKGNTTRPTGDKIKETLFNILAPDLYGAAFADLFAGSGGIGIEALSRGADHAVFIEKDKAAADCIKKNLETTHFTDKATLLRGDVLGVLCEIGRPGGYDIIFMDPPYGQGLEKSVLSYLLSNEKICTDDTLVIVECAADNDVSFAQTTGFDVIRIKDYKSSKHVFLKKRRISDEESDIPGQL